MSDTRNAMTQKKAAGLPSASLFEEDAQLGFENVRTDRKSTRLNSSHT